MNLHEFKYLVDTKICSTDYAELEFVKEKLIQQILECIPSSLTHTTRALVQNFESDLALRHLCGSETVQPYIDVASALGTALRKQGCSPRSEVNWDRALLLGAKLSTFYAEQIPVGQRWISDIRISSISAAIHKLRDLGYRIELPTSGGIVFSESERQTLKTEVLKLAESLGPSLAISISDHMNKMYCSKTGRFQLGRSGNTVELNAKPEAPFAYLYHLGLRFFSRNESFSAGADELNRLIELVSCGMALEDVGIPFFKLQFSTLEDLPEITQKSAVFDAAYTLAQAKPSHAATYIKWLLEQDQLEKLRDKKTRTCTQVKKLALFLLRISGENSHHRFVVIDPLEVASTVDLDLASTTEFLQEVFSHRKGANQTLSFPPNDMDIDAAFRPLVEDARGLLVLQPGPIAARAIVNASLDWCRNQWSNKRFDEEVVGPLFEAFVHGILSTHGVTASHGKYKVGNQEFECDAVVETKDRILFLELKSKMLTRKGRSGDDVVTLRDLAQAIVRPQAQAMNHHAHLKENGSIQLKRDTMYHTIEHKNREVLKIAVSRGELGSLHDRPYLHRLLNAGCIAEFVPFDMSRQQELVPLEDWFSRLKDATVRAGDNGSDGLLPFSRTWSISIFYLLVLLERTKDAESFVNELLRTRRIITPTRDPYREYVRMLELEASVNKKPA